MKTTIFARDARLHGVKPAAREGMGKLMRTVVLALAVASLMVGLLLPTLVSADTRWEATVEQGEMTVMRAGQVLRYESDSEDVSVVDYDVIRVGDQSKVILAATDKARITLGSNSVMEIRPWQRQKSRGVLRMLFGRIRAKLLGLGAGERFDVKTATATIGVKGSEFRTLVNPAGVTVGMCLEHECLISANGGDEVVVPSGYGAVSLGESLGEQFETPEELEGISDDAPASYLDDGEALNEDLLVDEGLVDEEALEVASEDLPELGDDPLSYEEPVTEGLQEEQDQAIADDAVDLDDIIQNAGKSYLEVNPTFEK